MGNDVVDTFRETGLRDAKSRFRNLVRTNRSAEGDAGAILVLALVFLMIGTIVIGALTGALTNDLSNSNTFKSVRSSQYAARGATNFAIQSMRYTPLLLTSQTLNASPPSYCWGSGPVSTFQAIDGVSGVTVWCSTAWNATSAQTRVVTFSTCLSSSIGPAQCAQNPFLQVVVTFDDYPSGISAPTTAACVTYCGSSMIVDSWLWSPAVPTVMGIGVTGDPSPSGPITGGTSVTITGSGFVAGTAVNFIEESNNVPTNDNMVLPVPVANVTVNGPNWITAITPAVTEGSTYYVTVTTPTGTSAYGTNVFTYQPVTPTVTGISPTSGLIGGGNAVTITGSGFLDGATVNFIEESNGVPVSPTVSVSATYVSVAGSTSITTVSPPVTATGTYFVTVATSDGTSVPGQVCPSYPPPTGTQCDTFQYGTLTPTISSITPASSSSLNGGTSMTVTGVGFDAGNTVTFVQFSGLTNGSPNTTGYSVNASSVTVNETGVTGTSTMTVVAPVVNSAGTYYVDVTTPQGTSPYSGSPDIFTYL